MAQRRRTPRTRRRVTRLSSAEVGTTLVTVSWNWLLQGELHGGVRVRTSAVQSDLKWTVDVRL